jgi:polysaccharide deacetylase 2 family uncharacterized protein YibQ
MPIFSSRAMCIAALLTLIPAMPAFSAQISAQTSGQISAQIAIIIDDVGNNHHRDAAALTLPCQWNPWRGSSKKPMCYWPA